jgi:hypothetical protein
VPRVRALDDPTPRLSAHLADEGPFAAPPDVRSNSAEANRGSYVRVVVALVEAQVFGASRAARATHDNRVEHVADHRGVWHVRSTDQRCDRHAAAIGQYMAFYAAFRPVRRVRPREVPPFAPSLRRCRENSISRRCRAAHRSRSATRDESPRTRRGAPTSENADGTSSPNRSRSATPSTGSPFSIDRGCLPSPLALRPVADHLAASRALAGSAARFDATVRRAHQQTLLPQTRCSSHSIQPFKRF